MPWHRFGTKAPTSRRAPGRRSPTLIMIKLEAAELAAKIKAEVKAEIDGGLRACLAAVRVGDDPASAVYVKNKIRACEEVGIRSEHHALPESTSSAELLDLVGSLNSRDDVDGILVQV